MDIRHFYLEQGEGFPLILLHGNGGNSDTFSHQIPVLSAVRHVYAPDTRGHGQTGRGSAPFTIAQFADDLAGFMDEHGLPQADVLGFSDGANIAMVFAVKYPGRVRKLILDGGNIRPFGVRTIPQIRIELACRKAERAARKDPQAVPRAEMLGLMVHDFRTTPQELAGIHTPTLVMAGTRDLIRGRHTRFIASCIPGARVVFIPGGHGIASENPEAFNRTVLEFLS